MILKTWIRGNANPIFTSNWNNNFLGGTYLWNSMIDNWSDLTFRIIITISIIFSSFYHRLTDGFNSLINKSN